MSSQQSEFVATVLQRGGNAFAAYAAADLLESHPNVAAQLAEKGMSLWKAWLADRIDELAAALWARKPELFTQQARWAASLFVSRNVPLESVQQALECLRTVLAKELPEDARELVDEYFRAALSAVATEPAKDECSLSSETPQGRLAASYLLAVLEGDRQQAAQLILDAASNGWSVTDLYTEVLVPAQRELGHMWLNNEINIADEHLATATTKAVMSRLHGVAMDQPRNGKTVVASAVRDNQHDLGLMMVADVFEMHGWKTIALGADLPIVDLVQAAEAHEADLLLISAALSSQLPAVRDTIRALRTHDATKQTKIIVGGPAFSCAADLATEYGADGYAADPIDALEMGNRLAGV